MSRHDTVPPVGTSPDRDWLDRENTPSTGTQISNLFGADHGLGEDFS
jgi:hypothetical protein